MTENHQRAYIFGLVAALLLATPVQARSRYQFQHFFPIWGGQLIGIRDNNCSTQWHAYNDPNDDYHYLPYNLAGCLIENMTEFQKTEMSIVSVVFGLLPTALMLIGPTTSEISLLARRRPLLAILLSIAMPSIQLTEGNPYSDPASYLREPVDISGRPWIFARPSLWALMSAAEYMLAAGAAANMVYQSYLIATHAVTVSTIAIYSEPLPMVYGPFLWIILILIVHACGGFAAGLRYAPNPDCRQAGSGLRLRLANELTPCTYGDPVWLVPRRKTYLYLAAVYATQLGVVALFLYATVILSSQIFISLGDAVPVIGLYLTGAAICRLILSIELHGMKEVTSLSLQDTAEHTAIEGRPEIVRKAPKTRTC
jgi:hypothetical protein